MEKIGSEIRQVIETCELEWFTADDIYRRMPGMAIGGYGCIGAKLRSLTMVGILERRRRPSQPNTFGGQGRMGHFFEYRKISRETTAPEKGD